jgi:cell division transport system ATP-binding protein
MKLLTKINKEEGTAVMMVTHNRNIFEKYPGRVFVCKEETCEENIDNEVIDLALTI